MEVSRLWGLSGEVAQLTERLVLEPRSEDLLQGLGYDGTTEIGEAEVAWVGAVSRQYGCGDCVDATPSEHVDDRNAHAFSVVDHRVDVLAGRSRIGELVILHGHKDQAKRRFGGKVRLRNPAHVSVEGSGGDAVSQRAQGYLSLIIGSECDDLDIDVGDVLGEGISGSSRAHIAAFREDGSLIDEESGARDRCSVDFKGLVKAPASSSLLGDKRHPWARGHKILPGFVEVACDAVPVDAKGASPERADGCASARPRGACRSARALGTWDALGACRSRRAGSSGASIDACASQYVPVCVACRHASGSYSHVGGRRKEGGTLEDHDVRWHVRGCRIVCPAIDKTCR